MTNRSREIILSMLSALARMKDAPLADALLHSATNVRLAAKDRTPASLDEFEGARSLAEGAQTIQPITGVLGARRWVITPAGEAALKECNE